MPLRDRKVGGFRGSIPAGYFLGRIDQGEGEVQLLSMEDILAAGLQNTIATAAASAATASDYLFDGGEPPQFITNGAGTPMRTS